MTKRILLSATHGFRANIQAPVVTNPNNLPDIRWVRKTVEGATSFYLQINTTKYGWHDVPFYQPLEQDERDK